MYCADFLYTRGGAGLFFTIAVSYTHLPGIPILAPGELVTQEIIDYILYAKAKGCSMTGPEDLDIERLNVLKE